LVEQDIYVEADGEVPGTLPAHWEILDRKVRVIIPDPIDSQLDILTTSTSSISNSSSSSSSLSSSISIPSD